MVRIRGALTYISGAHSKFGSKSHATNYKFTRRPSDMLKVLTVLLLRMHLLAIIGAFSKFVHASHLQTNYKFTRG